MNNIHTASKLGRTPPDSYSGRAINILIIGSDSRAGDKNQALVGGEDDGERSDTTMIMHISKDRSHVNVVSIPRDLLVDIPACDLGNGTESSPEYAQFNWAFSIGGTNNDRTSAVLCTWKTVEKLSGMRIDESVVVDFSGFTSMIDALGGINVYIPTAIHDQENSGLNLEAGCTHFNGQQALGYARVREGVEGSDGSDLKRIERQQAVMGIMMRTAMQKNMLTSLNQLYDFIGSGLRSLSISEGISSVSEMAGLGWSLQSLKPENLRFVTLPVYPAPTDPNRVVVKDEEVRPIWEAFINDTSLPVGVGVRDGNGKVYTIEAESSASPSASSPSGDTTSGKSTESNTTTSSPQNNGNDASSQEPNDDLVALQRKCEAKK
ncbi:LCP family protein [Varibaculum vaginae]|uniref:LCP family protein n=1 Tax=Varibaculum vaginae TaxID=2364797 RepID=UPI0011C40C92|nr:LCP family protein [Varibaculum vaginae]